DRSSPSTADARPALGHQRWTRARHADGPQGRRAGDAASKSPRLLNARALSLVWPRRILSLLRFGPDVSERARHHALSLLRFRARASAQLPVVRTGGRALSGTRHREIAGGN